MSCHLPARLPWSLLASLYTRSPHNHPPHARHHYTAFGDAEHDAIDRFCACVDEAINEASDAEGETWGNKKKTQQGKREQGQPQSHEMGEKQWHVKGTHATKKKEVKRVKQTDAGEATKAYAL